MIKKINKIKNNIDNLIIFFFVLLVFIFKIYLVIISPIPEGGTIYVTNTFLFLNFKTFLIDASSFNDWNHIGTPVYYVYFLINLIFSGELADNYKFFINTSHALVFFFYVLAISFFVKLIKKSVELKYIFAVLLFFFSSFAQIQSLEYIDPHSFQGPVVLILVSFFIKIFLNKKNKINFFELAFLCLIFSIATSVKTSFLPFCISFYIAVIFFFFQNKKPIKFFFIFNLLIIAIMILINLPIAGRLPLILDSVLLSRNDTTFDALNIISLAKVFIQIGIKENVFYLIFILINIFLFSKFVIFDNIIKFFKKNLDKSNYIIIVFSTLIFASYLYLIISASEEYLRVINNDFGIGFRHAYIYSIFIIFAFIFYKAKNAFLEKTYIYLSVIVFVFSVIFYVQDRNSYKSEIDVREKLFQNYLYSKIKKDGKIAVFNNSLSYGFTKENNFYRGNNLFQNDRFADFAYKQYPKIRYIRLHDFLQWESRKKREVFEKREKYPSGKKALMLKWDGFLKKHLHNKTLYKFFSYNSLAITENYPFPSRSRSKNLFLKKANEKISYAVFSNSSIFKGANITPEEFIKLVIKNYKVLKTESFEIKGDKWFLINFAQ